MSSDSKPNKPMPSPAEINAYLEQSAARTRMRLPLAKGAAAVVEPKDAAKKPAAPALRVGGGRALPLQSRSEQPATPEPARGADTPGESPEWRPFASDDEG